MGPALVRASLAWVVAAVAATAFFERDLPAKAPPATWTQEPAQSPPSEPKREPKRDVDEPPSLACLRV